MPPPRPAPPSERPPENRWGRLWAIFSAALTRAHPRHRRQVRPPSPLHRLPNRPRPQRRWRQLESRLAVAELAARSAAVARGRVKAAVAPIIPLGVEKR